MQEEFDETTEWPFRDGESWKTGSSLKQDRIEQYIEWLVTPRAERVPKTKKKLAEQLGVTSATLRNYDKEAYVQREVVRRGRGLAKVEQAASVLESLYSRATDPDGGAAANTAARIWLDWIDRETKATEDLDLSKLDTEELIELMMRLDQEVKKQAE